MDTLFKLNEGIPFECEIHCPRFNYEIYTANKGRNDVFRVFINSTEPQISCQPIQDVILKHQYFDLILTKTPEILKSCSNSQLFLFGDTWIDDTINEVKDFSISYMCSFHTNPYLAYEQRRELWYKQDEILIPKKFWSSRLNPIDVSKAIPYCEDEYKEKLPLFDSMFSICLENSKEQNYFTEKIIDCLRSKVIPIYWGCPNIDDYFNMDGIIVVENIADLIKISNKLTPDFYYSREYAINDNYNRSKKYFPIKSRIQSAIIHSRNILENSNYNYQ